MTESKIRLLLIDGAPGDILYQEILGFLKHNFIIIVNVNGIENITRLRDVFQDRIDYVSFDKTSKLELIREIMRDNLGYHVIKLRLGPRIDKEVIESATSYNLVNSLRIIAQTGVGVNHIDCEAATKCGVFVTNTPAVNSNAVAEFVILQMLAVARNLVYYATECSSSRWPQNIGSLRHFELNGKILGIIGMSGNIATKLASKADALGMKVIGYSVSSNNQKTRIGPCKRVQDFKTFLSSADFISIHTPLTETTKNLIGITEFLLMKKGVVLINTARGGIINEMELAQELRRENRNVAGVALDVHLKELSEFSSPLAGFNNVLITPHIAGTTSEALHKAARHLVANVVAILNGLYDVPIVNRDLITYRG